MTVPFKLHTERLFRETPNVHFSDITVPDSNALDLVRHNGPAVSPPDRDGEKQFYLHYQQTDNNRVLFGSRLFELVCPYWSQPYWFVYLTPETGALEIPERTFHRSYSCKDGSILINHAVRQLNFSERTEFVPTRPVMEKLPPPSFYNITGREAAHFIEHGTLS